MEFFFCFGSEKSIEHPEVLLVFANAHIHPTTKKGDGFGWKPGSNCKTANAGSVWHQAFFGTPRIVG